MRTHAHEYRKFVILIPSKIWVFASKYFYFEPISQNIKFLSFHVCEVKLLGEIRLRIMRKQSLTSETRVEV